MKRYLVTSLVLALVTLIAFVYPQQFSKSGGVLGQKRRPRRVAAPQAARKAPIDYSRFSHATKQHQEACKTCHKVPTANWQKVREFPDVADFPDHDACVRCHRAQFFKGAQPVICTVCHTKTSPRDDARLSFRNPNRPQQFTIAFPHDRHQDVIAALRSRPKFRQFVSASLVKSAHALDDKAKKYNNCEICHVPNTKAPVAPAAGWIDAYKPAVDTFKASPDNHASCFNCHWSGQEPVRDNCAGCHKAPAGPASASVKRFSMKFRHEGGGEKKNHLAECTACHINITKSATLRGLKPDVPITGCTECHNKVGLREDLNKELAAIDQDKSFTCSYCHTSDIGKLDPPASHYIVAERPPLKRKDVK
jgi:hypothetical protein